MDQRKIDYLEKELFGDESDEPIFTEQEKAELRLETDRIREKKVKKTND